jgi:DNA-binding response OmpR family regulator
LCYRTIAIHSLNLIWVSKDRYLVVTAEDGATALDLISKETFDLYILDNWLPEMDGLEICRRIRESGSVKPIIFFSAMVRAADREKALEAGANEYLLKPNDGDADFVFWIKSFCHPGPP